MSFVPLCVSRHYTAILARGKKYNRNCISMLTRVSTLKWWKGLFVRFVKGRYVKILGKMETNVVKFSLLFVNMTRKTYFQAVTKSVVKYHSLKSLEENVQLKEIYERMTRVNWCRNNCMVRSDEFCVSPWSGSWKQDNNTKLQLRNQTHNEVSETINSVSVFVKKNLAREK